MKKKSFYFFNVKKFFLYIFIIQSNLSAFSFHFSLPSSAPVPQKTGFSFHLAPTQAPVQKSTGFSFHFTAPVINQDDPAEQVFFKKNYTISMQSFSLGFSIGNLFETYQQKHTTGTPLFSFSLVTAAKSAPVLSFNTTAVSDFEKTTFAEFQTYLSGSTGSYTAFLNELWPLYVQYIQSLKDQASQIAVAQQPFQKGSTALSMYTQLIAQIITFIKIKIGQLSLTNFASSDALYFLTTELPALDATVAKMYTIFDTHFSGSSGDGYPDIAKESGTQSAQLKQNYTDLQNAYTQQKGLLFADFVIKLLQSLSTSYSPNVALSGLSTTIMGLDFSSNSITTLFSALQNYYTILSKSFQTMNNSAQQIGTYQTPQAALQALSGWLASLYLYAALIGKNNSEQLAVSADGQAYQNGTMATGSTFLATIENVIMTTQNFYQNTAQYYAYQSDIVQSSAYAQISSLLSGGMAQWKKAESLLSKGSFAASINAYQSAASMFKKTGMFQLASLLTKRSDMVSLLYYQVLLKMYLQYYQQEIAQSITQMSTPPSETITVAQAKAWHTAYPDGFIQLFYYDPGTAKTNGTPTFQGIGWLCQQALPICNTMLTTYQCDTSVLGNQIKEYLTQSITILQNIVNGSSSMFYNDVVSNTQTPFLQNAANANSGSLTVKGTVESFLQYNAIYQAFKKADTALEQTASAATKGSATTIQIISTLPFAGIFSGTQLSGFSDFSLLSQMYWMIMNIDPALATAKQYPKYQNTLVSAALVLATYAQALAKDPSLKNCLSATFFTYIQNKIDEILQQTYASDSALSMVKQEGKQLIAEQSESLDFDSALACFMAAGLQGDVDAQASFFSTISLYTESLAKNTTIVCPSLQAAMIYYAAYLAQKKGWQSSSNYLNLIESNLKAGAQELGALVSTIKNLYSQGNADQGLLAAQQLNTLQTLLQGMLIRQKREQLLYTNAPDLFSVTTGTLPSGEPTFLYTSPLCPQVTFPVFIDPSYMTAECYVQQGQSYYKTLQQNFASGVYTNSLQASYQQLNDAFSKASRYFSTAGYFDKVLTVQQLITQAAAFSYMSLVIPSDQTTQALQSVMSTSPSFTETFVQNQQQTSGQKQKGFQFKVSQPVASQASSKPYNFSILFHTEAQSSSQKKSSTNTTLPGTAASVINPLQNPLVPDEQPSYLLRYNEQDLTTLAVQEAQVANATKASQRTISTATSSSSVSSAAPVATYQQLEVIAQSFLKTVNSKSTTPADTSLVATIVVPLYERFLTDNSYTSQFSTQAQEVARYTKQVTQLVSGGMQIAGKTIMTEYTLEKRLQPDGTTHIILITYNGPLQGIPRFSGEYTTALFFYTQYAQFFAQNPTTVQIGGVTYNQIADPQNTQTAQAFKNIVGTYWTQFLSYQKIVSKLLTLAPAQMPLDQLKNYNFSSYAPLYALLTSAYSWIFSALSALDDVQKSEGIYWVSEAKLTTTQVTTYKNFMSARARFLVGYPLDISYKQVLKDIASLVYMATQSTQSISEQAGLLQSLGDCYAQAGMLTATYNEPLPAVDGYPNPGPSLLPSQSLQLKKSFAGCQAPEANGIQNNQNFTITWNQYYGGSEFYAQALSKYQQAYQLSSPGATNALEKDQKTKTAWGYAFLYLTRSIAQRISLLARNAFQATVTPAANGSEEINMTVSPAFLSMVAQGQSNGAISAAQGFSALQGGALVASGATNQQEQYAVMKKMILDALIYASSAQQQTSTASQTNSSNAKTNDQLGQVLKCGIGYYMPGLQMLAAQKQAIGQAYESGTTGENQTETVEVETPVIALPASEVSLSSLGQSDTQQLVYANTFPALVDYCVTTLMGSSQGSQPFSNLAYAANVASLNNFASQLYDVLQSVYSWLFLPASDQNNPEQLANDVSAAIKAEQQNMVVNSQDYVG